MPFFSFVLPEWFGRKYPKMATNMKNNTERLTTPFDIYSTLMSVLHKDGPKTNDVIKRSISLFDEVQVSRLPLYPTSTPPTDSRYIHLSLTLMFRLVVNVNFR